MGKNQVQDSTINTHGKQKDGSKPAPQWKKLQWKEYCKPCIVDSKPKVGNIY